MSKNSVEYVNKLIEKGYKYMYMFKDAKDEFIATKAIMKKDGTFKDSANFDTYKLDEGETYPFDKGVFINLTC